MSTPRFRALAIPIYFGWLAVLFQGCSGEPQQVQLPPGTILGVSPVYSGIPMSVGAPCNADEQCPTKLCRDGRCAIQGMGVAVNGAECNADAHCRSWFCNGGICDVPGATRLPNRAMCGNDARCQSEFCDDGVCAVLRTDLLPNGEACSTDTQCQMGHCDRGVCGRIISWRSYGVPCVPAAPGTPIREISDEAYCVGYLCMDGRCRSCRSDSECVRWQPAPGVPPSNEPLTCTKFNDWPGKQCGKVIPGQACPNGNPPVPQSWSNEGPFPARTPAVALPDGGLPGPSRPAIDCQTWPDM
jgi:hypothetical protein